MIRILLVTPFSKDANSYHRCNGPWSYLTKVARRSFSGEDQIEFSVAQDDIGMSGVAWDVVSQFDMVFFHRPCRDHDLTILKIARNLNVPTWIDYDDWLFDVPYWNPAARTYNNTGVQHVMATMLATADVVSVTTAALYEKLKTVNKNVVIVPNSYRSDLYPYRAAKPPARKQELFWRGSNTHDADMLSVRDAWNTLPAKTTFFGGAPWIVLSQMPAGSFEVRDSQDPFLYMREIYRAAPKVAIFPLVDCLFNRVKSNIAYQEALHAGALIVAPSLPEWLRLGVYNYEAGNAESFKLAVAQAFDKTEREHSEEVENAYASMKDLYDAPNVNQIRLDLLRAILDPAFERNERDPFDQLVGMWALSQLKPAPQPAKPLKESVGS